MGYAILLAQRKRKAKCIKCLLEKGKDETDPNLADYPTKHHSILHHRGIRPFYVLDQLINHISNLAHTSQVLRGCVDLA